MENTDDWLHLFTSNIRELYLQDALSLLSAPEGLQYRFRYEKRYVADKLLDAWTRNGLVGCQVATYFSLQHPLNFHEAAFLPLRVGTVAASGVEGRIFVVDFTLEDYLPLVDEDKENRARPVREFTAALKGILHGAYPDNHEDNYARSLLQRSAAVGKSPLGLRDKRSVPLIDASAGHAGNFERVVNFVSPCVTPARPFFRVARVTDEAGAELKLAKTGRLELTPEKSYTMEIVQYGPDQLGGDVSLELTVPESIEALSETTIPLRSRYDVIQIRLFVPARDNTAQGEIAVSAGGPLGPAIRIPVQMSPTSTQTLLSPATALFGAGLVAIPGLMGDGNTGAKIGLALIGAVALAFSVFDRRRRGLSG